MSSGTYGATRRTVTLTGSGAVGLLFLISLVGAVYDIVTGPDLARGFAIALVAGALVASLVVRRSALYAVVVAPPIVYMVVAIIGAIATKENEFASKTSLTSALANWLVYGFPEMAVATAVAVLITGVRALASK